MIEVQRLQAGVSLEGPHYVIQLIPVCSADSLGSPTVIVSVLARPALTGDDRNVRLEAYDVRHEFRLADIAVDAHEMRCLRIAYERAPLFREGFTLALEDGMAAQLAAYLPRIDLISLVATGVSDAIKPKLGRAPAPHEQAVIADVVASTVLDQSTPAQAMAFAMGFGSACVFSDPGRPSGLCRARRGPAHPRSRRHASGRPARPVMRDAHPVATPSAERRRIQLKHRGADAFPVRPPQERQS